MTIETMRAHAEDLARGLTEFAGMDPREIRRKALHAISEAVEADFSTFFNIVEVDGTKMPTDVQVEGHPGGAQFEAAIRRAPAEVFGLFDVRRPPVHVLERFDSPIRIFSREEFENTPIFQTLWRPIGATDCAGLLVFHGPRYLGSPAAVWDRSRGPIDDELESLQPLVAPVRDAMTAAHCLALKGLPTETGYVIARPDGNFEHASPEGKIWLEREGVAESIRRRVDDLDHSREPGESTTLENAEARIVRLATEEGTRYLVCLRPAPLIRRNSPELLTALQLRIASSAAAGATAAEIARDLDRSIETVREHLREIYRRLGVSSRVGLARVLSDGAAP